MLTLIVRVVLIEILYFCDRAYVTTIDLSDVMPILQKNIDINETVWNSLGGKVYTQVLAVGLRPSGLEHSRCSTRGQLCVLYRSISFNHYNCRIQNSKIYRALIILSLKPKFTPCLHGIARLKFLCSWMPRMSSFMIIHINKYIYTYIPRIKMLVKTSVGSEMSYTIQNMHISKIHSTVFLN